MWKCYAWPRGMNCSQNIKSSSHCVCWSTSSHYNKGPRQSTYKEKRLILAHSLGGLSPWSVGPMALNLCYHGVLCQEYPVQLKSSPGAQGAQEKKGEDESPHFPFKTMALLSEISSTGLYLLRLLLLPNNVLEAWCPGRIHKPMLSWDLELFPRISHYIHANILKSGKENLKLWMLLTSNISKQRCSVCIC